MRHRTLLALLLVPTLILAGPAPAEAILGAVSGRSSARR